MKTEGQDKVKSQVKEFIGENNKKLKITKRILEYEEDGEPTSTFGDKDEVDKCSWIPGDDVSMPPSYIGMFKSAPFVNIIFDSRSKTRLCLEDYESTKEAIEDIEDEPEKWSEEWFEKLLGESKIDKVLKDVNVSDDEVEEIRSITEDVDALGYWSTYIAPELKHRDLAKKAILIILASPEDKHGTKGRVNMLAYGPPGTGKSAIKNYLVDKFDVESIDGPRVSKADITYNKKTDEFGQLPNAHKGILVVEESDEMEEGPLGAALTSLGESGKIEIRDKEIPAEARGIFLSNFSTVDEAIHQWSEESVNRFDFTIEFDRLDAESKDEAIDWHYKYFRQPKPNENEDLFLKYLKLCRQHHPDIIDQEEISEYRRDNIEELENVREGISVMNIAWIIARLNLEDVTIEHYTTAFNLVAQ